MSDLEDTDGVGFIERPAVARRARKVPAVAGYALIGMVGLGVLMGMSSRRMSAAEAGTVSGAPLVHTSFVAPQMLPQSAAPTSEMAAGDTMAAPQFSVDNSMPASPELAQPMMAPPVASAMPPANATPGATRLSAPAVVVDLGEPREGISAGAAAKPMAALANPALAQAGAKSGEAGEAQFIRAVSGENAPAVASRLDRPDAVITEGTVIGATLETAINSDLPGFARAVVARDVMSFDGTRLLIPRGSRVIGEYKSGAAAGASRVFVIWTRLIRPDGASIQLVSPGGDDLGRGGLSGKIDRHFLQRFGGSLLMSVVNGGINAGVASIGHGVPVYISSVAEAGSAAASAFKTPDIPPTVKISQGSAVRIFVARDLDFSGIEGAR